MHTERLNHKTEKGEPIQSAVNIFKCLWCKEQGQSPNMEFVMHIWKEQECIQLGVYAIQAKGHNVQAL